MLIVEILPVPFTALYGIYAVRRRPRWIPGVVERMYADKPSEKAGKRAAPQQQSDALTTRRNCTIALITMFLVDVIVPFTVPFGIYIVRRRPVWFKEVVGRLYADQHERSEAGHHEAAAEALAHALERRHKDLERRNQQFARTLRKKLS